MVRVWRAGALRPRVRAVERPPDRLEVPDRLLLAEAPRCVEFFDAMTRMSCEKASETGAHLIEPHR